MGQLFVFLLSFLPVSYFFSQSTPNWNVLHFFEGTVAVTFANTWKARFAIALYSLVEDEVFPKVSQRAQET